MHSGGAGLSGSLPDYLACLAILVREGRGINGVQILKPETVRELLSPQVNQSMLDVLKQLRPLADTAVPDPE